MGGGPGALASASQAWSLHHARPIRQRDTRLGHADPVFSQVEMGLRSPSLKGSPRWTPLVRVKQTFARGH